VSFVGLCASRTCFVARTGTFEIVMRFVPCCSMSACLRFQLGQLHSCLLTLKSIQPESDRVSAINLGRPALHSFVFSFDCAAPPRLEGALGSAPDVHACVR
jgi:hypothetical protein